MLIWSRKINKTQNFKSFDIENELFLKKKKKKKNTRKSLIRVDSYKKIDKYLKKAYPKNF